MEALSKRLLPTLDVDFLQGEDFKSACCVVAPSLARASCLLPCFRLLHVAYGRVCMSVVVGS
jgi:hypothetical protein